MPDHEEVVREAVSELHALFQRNQIGRWPDEVDAFEHAIRASERAKYAALVEAATAIDSLADFAQVIAQREVEPGPFTRLKVALAALQEGTNE